MSEQSNEEELLEIVQEVGERVKEITERVHPLRVALAGIIILLILGSGLASRQWIVPRDVVVVDTIFIQRSGHLIMSELSNSGSRDISDVEFNVEFIDSEKTIIGEYSTQFDSIPSHTSISGNSMELVVRGYTVWENYTIVISIKWVDFTVQENIVVFCLEVGAYAYEEFNDKCESTTWFI